MFHLPGILLSSEKLEVPLVNTNFTERKGDEEQAQPQPIAASKLSPTASAQVEPVPTDDRKAGSRRDQVHRKPFV